MRKLLLALVLACAALPSIAAQELVTTVCLVKKPAGAASAPQKAASKASNCHRVKTHKKLDGTKVP